MTIFFHPNKIKIDEKSYKNIFYLLHWICDDVKINSLNFLYPLYNSVNEYFEEIDNNRYMTLVPTNESKQILKKYEKLCIKSEI